MRHGEAEANAASDEVRNLTHYGLSQATLAGKLLQRLGFEFDQVWVSPYVRAMQTADAVLSAYPENVLHRETTQLLVPEALPADITDRIAEAPDCNLLLVSHQPLVSALVGVLEEGHATFGPPMAPATMALLTAESILPGCCQLQWLKHAPYNVQV